MAKNNEKEEDRKEFDFKSMQANFSALLYILTEQQALIGKLIQHLAMTGVLDSRQISEITDIYSNEEVLSPVYREVYKRFVQYYISTQQILDDVKNLTSKEEEDLGSKV